MRAQKKFTLLVFAVFLIAATVIVGPIVGNRITNYIHAPIYAMQTGELVVDYMRANDDHWPNDWNDLAKHLAADRLSWLADVRRNVGIDFGFDPTSVDLTIDRHLNGIPISPVSMTNGVKLNHDSYPDPNAIIFDYLKNQSNALTAK